MNKELFEQLKALAQFWGPQIDPFLFFSLTSVLFISYNNHKDNGLKKKPNLLRGRGGNPRVSRDSRATLIKGNPAILF